MAAPSKIGLDYFPFDTDLLGDMKLRKPKMKHGYLSTIVYISLLSLLYRDKGYYIDYRDKDDVIWQVLNDLQGKHQPAQETVADVIEDLVACGLFSGDLYQSGIITSLRSQMTYYKATVDRKTVDIKSELWLLDLEQMKELSAKHCYYLKCLNKPNNEVNRPNNEVNRPNNQQSKVKDSTVHKSTVNDNATDGDNHDKENAEELIRLFQELLGHALSDIEHTAVMELARKYGIRKTESAALKALEYGKRSIPYIGKILENATASKNQNDNGDRQFREHQGDPFKDLFET